MTAQLRQLVDSGANAKDIPEKQRNGMLNDALEGLRSLGKKVETSKEQQEVLKDAVIFAGETQVANAAASMVAGYRGPEGMQLGPVDVRTAAALTTGSYGLYKLVQGKQSGAHALAVANGLLASVVSEKAAAAGQALREKWSKKEEKPAPAAETPPPAKQIQGEVDIEGLIRQIEGRAIYHRANQRARDAQPRGTPGRRAPADRVRVRIN